MSESLASKAFEAQENHQAFEAQEDQQDTSFLEEPSLDREPVEEQPSKLQRALTSSGAVTLRLLSKAGTTCSAARPAPLLDESLWLDDDDDDEEEGFRGWAMWTPASFCAPEELLPVEKQDSPASSSTLAEYHDF